MFKADTTVNVWSRYNGKCLQQIQRYMFGADTTVNVCSRYNGKCLQQIQRYLFGVSFVILHFLNQLAQCRAKGEIVNSLQKPCKNIYQLLWSLSLVPSCCCCRCVQMFKSFSSGNMPVNSKYENKILEKFVWCVNSCYTTRDSLNLSKN